MRRFGTTKPPDFLGNSLAGLRFPYSKQVDRLSIADSYPTFRNFDESFCSSTPFGRLA